MSKDKKEKMWFLVKKEWTENELLTDKQYGMLIRALYSSSMPEDDLVKGMYIAYMQEYARVNGFMVEQAKARSEKASKASNARWGNVDPMLENADPMLKHASIDIGKDIGIGKDTAIGKGKAAYNNYINSINE